MFTRYKPRLCAYLGESRVRGYRLKTYSIVPKKVRFELNRFEPAIQLATGALPQPAVTPSRPGVGLLIFHQGATGDYIVMSWWDNENEMPTRVFVRESNTWRSAAESESFCVWDLKVMWHEREAYVQTLLAGLGPAEYMKMTLSESV